MYSIRSGGAGVGIRFLSFGFRLLTRWFLYGCWFVYFFESFQQCRDIRLVGVISDRDGFVFEITDEVLDTFLEGDILHDLIATSLAMQVAREDHCLAVRAPFQAFPLKGEGE